jgi:hypothetical protein
MEPKARLVKFHFLDEPRTGNGDIRVGGLRPGYGLEARKTSVRGALQREGARTLTQASISGATGSPATQFASAGGVKTRSRR